MRKIYLSACFVGVLLLTNCQDDLNTVNPNNLTSATYFKNASELREAVNSIYAVAHSNRLASREWFFAHSLRSPDHKPGGGQLETHRRAIIEGTVAPGNGVGTEMWNGFYTLIHRANTVIANAATAEGDANSIKQSLGEAKFLRAWAYYELVNFFGGVPVYTAPVTGVDAFAPRSNPEDVYKLVVQDLLDAQTALPAGQTMANQPSDSKGRATADAATALLGKAYIQQGDYAKAKVELEKLVGKYALTSVYNNNFREENEFNSESIWEINYVARPSDNGYNWDGEGNGQTAAESTVRSQETSPIAWRNLVPAEYLLNEYEVPETGSPKRDPRLDYTVYFSGDTYDAGTKTLTDAQQNGVTTSFHGKPLKASWEKYTVIYQKLRSAPTETNLLDPGFHPGGINTRVIRYAEVLLLLAECENEVGSPAAAVTYLNQLRNRADVMMPEYPNAQFPTGSKEQVWRAIVHESAVERGGEEGRDFDILRWMKKGIITTPYTAFTFNPARDYVLPIPSDEVNRYPQLANGGLTAQNPNY
jgi:starch-binding outer membrane protein, SusD/RagB family